MNNPNDEKESFEYDGRLVINAVYAAEDGALQSLTKDDALAKLTAFEEGTPSQPGFGFDDLQLQEWLNRYSDISPMLKSVTEEVIDLAFTKEKYDLNEEVVDSDGDAVEGFIRDEWSAYAYLYPGKYLFLQGSQGKMDDLQKQLSPLFNGSNFRPIEFDPEFLLWLVWKSDVVNGPPRLDIDHFSDAIMKGNLSYFGRSNEVSDSRSITNSHPIIAGILDDRNFDKLEGIFEIADPDGESIKVDAQLYADGNIRVMAQKSVGSAHQFKRTLITNLFLEQLLETYLEWEELDPKHKYVHPRYFHTLYEQAKDMTNGAEYDFDYDSLVKKYADLREEDPKKHANLDFD